MVGAPGFEPGKSRSQSPVPYRLATPQYMAAHTRIELVSSHRQCDMLTFTPMSRWREH